MKRNRIYLIIFLLLAFAAIILYFSQKSGTIPRELKDFALEDTASINKIYLAGKSGQEILLVRSNNHWIVNEKYIVRKDAIDVLLKTIKRMDIKSPVPKASFETVVKNLATEHTKVEIYTDQEKPKRVFYVGGSTADNYGTYMMLDKSSTPFVMHIPGFAGYLSTRFFLQETAWRDVSLFKYQFDEIISVQLENIRNPDESFIAINRGNNQFELNYLSTDKSFTGFDTLKVKEYLSAFKKLSFERFVDELSPEEKDSIFRIEPEYIITLNDTEGLTTRLEAILRAALLPDENFPYDPDRMYGRINKEEELVIIQYFNFDPLFKDISDFKLN